MSIPEDSLDCASDWKRFFLTAGYGLNTFLRETVRSVDDLVRPMPKETATLVQIEGRVKQAAMAVFSMALASVLIFPSTFCYGVAACLDGGRFEVLRPETPTKAWEELAIKIMSWNACLQDPWSTMTGGVVPPLDPVEGKPNRVAAVVDAIPEDVQVFLGQEFESLAAQEEAIERLKSRGFRYFERDLGGSALNGSGCYVASKVPISFQFIPYPLADRAGLALGSMQGAVVCTIQVAGRALRLINTHLNYGTGEKNQAARERQLERIRPLLDDEVPTVLFGDLNFDITAMLKTNEQFKKLTNALEGKVTCTDEGKHELRGKPLDGCTDCEEKIDAVVYDAKRVEVVELEQIAMPRVSDHFGTVATLKVK